MLTKNKPLDGVTVLEFSQFLSGPVAGLRLADLGARVIKIERYFFIIFYLYFANILITFIDLA